MKVKEVMTAESLKTCSRETKLKDAAKLMEEGGCGILPVLEGNGKVVGIITDRDISLSLAREHSWSHCHLPVNEVMSIHVHSIHENTNIETALREMRTHHVGRLPVVDSHNRLKGILSIHNLFTKPLMDSEEISHLSHPAYNIVKTVKELSVRYTLRTHPLEPPIAENDVDVSIVY